MSLLDRVEAKDYDDRTVAEQLRDLGLEKETITLEKIRWVRPYSSHPRAGLVTVGKTSVSLPVFVIDDLGERVLIGTGKYQGRPVLLIRASQKGYKVYSANHGNKKMINSAKMVEGLLRAGVKRGYYEPVKVRGGWMCERVTP